jgi:hypothetical protein
LMLLIAPGMISLVQANWNLNNGLLTLAIEGPEVTQKYVEAQLLICQLALRSFKNVLVQSFRS